VDSEVFNAVRGTPEELGRKLGISTEGAKELKAVVEFWHRREVV
jgi:hypothetical protein